MLVAFVGPIAVKIDAQAALHYIEHYAASTTTQEGDLGQPRAALLATDAFGFFAVWSNAAASAAAKSYWQHSGSGLSTRGAAMVLADGVIQDDAHQRNRLRHGLQAITEVPSERIFLFPSGMAAFTAAVRAIETVQAARGHAGTWAQIGFPYVDILKVQQQFTQGGGTLFRDLDEAERSAAAAWTGMTIEVPGNPLLRCPDLAAARRLADQRGALLLVDDTIATPAAVRIQADLVMTSLTKAVAGCGTVLAGSVVVPEGPQAQALAVALRAQDPEDQALLGADAERVAGGLASLPQRLGRMSRGLAPWRLGYGSGPKWQRCMMPPNSHIFRRCCGTRY